MNSTHRGWVRGLIGVGLVMAVGIGFFRLKTQRDALLKLDGLHAEARRPLLQVVSPEQVSETVEDLPQSAGLHLPDAPRLTTAALDLNVEGRTPEEIRSLLDALGRRGFAAWYRLPGRDGWPTRYGPHIHAVWAAGPLKPGLRRQVQDYLRGRNGLRSHAPYAFFVSSREALNAVRRRYRDCLSR